MIQRSSTSRRPLIRKVEKQKTEHKLNYVEPEWIRVDPPPYQTSHKNHIKLKTHCYSKSSKTDDWNKKAKFEVDFKNILEKLRRSKTMSKFGTKKNNFISTTFKLTTAKGKSEKKPKIEIFGKKEFNYFPQTFENLKVHQPQIKTEDLQKKGKKYGDLSLEEVIEADEKVDSLLKKSFYKLRNSPAMIHCPTFS